MENMKLWKDAFVTDPSAVKPITGKQYSGNSPKPYWIVQRATELLGPCGIGWGVQILDERIERFGDVDSVHIAKVRVWYQYDGKRGEIEQMGQTKMSYKTSKGSVMLDEDAPKKSVTDAMVKCLSYIGLAGDIFSGRWDDSGYVRWAAEETARRESAAAAEEVPKLSEDQQAELAALISETGTDFEQFMKWVSNGAGYDVKALKDAPAACFDAAKKILEKRKQKQG